MPEFRDLLAAKARFIVPATVFFLVYYFTLPVLVGLVSGGDEEAVAGAVEWRVSICAVAVFDDVDRGDSLYARGGSLRPICQEYFVAGEGAEQVMSTPLLMFLGFIVDHTGHHRLGGAAVERARAGYFAAGRNITGWQNGIAVAGDYMSAASFLGIAGIIAFQGYDGFMYSVGWLVAYLTVLLVVAEPLRNAGKYTMADVLAYRLKPRPVRAMASLSTLTVSTFYMIAQMVGAGTLVACCLKDSASAINWAVIGVGILMVVYVVFGGMLATTWVQIIKAILLMAGTILLSVLVLAHFHFSFAEFFDAIAHVIHDAGGKVVNFLQPGLRYKPPYGALDLISLGLALIFGTAGLPHILVRFYTVPDAKTARISVVWAMFIIGGFYIMTTFLGFGAATIVGSDFIKTHGGINMSAPLLAQRSGGRCLLRIHFGDCVRDDSGGGGGTDNQRLDFVRARFLHQRDPQGRGAQAGRRGSGGADHSVCGGGGVDRDCDRAGSNVQCGVPGGAGVCGGGLGESAGDCAVDFLEAVQYGGRDVGAGDGCWSVRWP